MSNHKIDIQDQNTEYQTQLEGDNPNPTNDTINDQNEVYTKIYGEEYSTIKKLLDSLKNSHDFFTPLFSDLEKKTSLLYTEINNKISLLSSKIQNFYEITEKDVPLIQNYTKIFLDRYKSILGMYQQISENIRQNIQILLNFLDITSKSLDEDEPTFKFIDKEFQNIIENWMLFKIDFLNYDFSEILSESKIEEDKQKLILNTCKNKICNLHLYNYKPDEIDEKTKEKFHVLLEHSHDYLKMFGVENITGLSEYLQNQDFSYNYSNMEKLLVYHSYILPNPKKSFFSSFPNLSFVKLSSCNNIDINVMQDLPKNLKELYLTKNGFVNMDFNVIIEEIMKNDAIRERLEILSFAGNAITTVDFNSLITSQRNNFSNLKFLDLHSNRIYTILGINSENFPDLKSLDISYNSLNKNHFANEKKILVFQSGNVYLTNDTLAKKYFNDLKEKLKTSNAIIKRVYLSFINKVLSKTIIPQIIISSGISLNLIKLDLGYNNLNNESILKFFNNNKKLFNLKCINLNGNELDEGFFEIYLKDKFYEIYENLEKISLDRNFFGVSAIKINYNDNEEIKENDKKYEDVIFKLRLLYKFIEKNKKLQVISLTKNQMGKLFTIKEGDVKDRINSSISKNKEGKIIINDFYSFLVKVNNEISKEEGREYFNIRFDCGNDFNRNLIGFPFDRQLIIYKN